MHLEVYLTILALFLPSILGKKLEPLTSCPERRLQSFEDLAKLRNCDIIEGNFIIAFRFASSAEEWRELGGLKVTEITGFVLLFLVDHLPSLELLLPRLRVIRGDSLFMNYALVINGLMDLENIGLSKLSTIIRGSVHIQNNPKLSHYAKTVNWNAITLWNSNELNYPNYIQNVESAVQLCPEHCRPDANHNSYCWSSAVCQNVCPRTKNSLSCMDNGHHCPSDCLGGCYFKNSTVFCHACRGFRYFNRCRDSCFPHYEFDNYRCVTRKQCVLEFGRKIVNQNITRRLCVPKCSSALGLIEDPSDPSVCKSCAENDCEIVCDGRVINNVEDLQKMSSCTKIKGSLDIRIQGRKMMDELTTYLGSIREVDGYVRVFKSGQIESLRFFRNLSKINGEELWENSFSLAIYDNENIIDLWNLTSSEKLKIGNGRVMFFGNPKLCTQKIEELVGKEVWESSVPDPQTRDILNGNKKACNVNKNFTYTLTPMDKKGEVSIAFRFDKLDTRGGLVGFYIHYREVEQSKLQDDREWDRVYTKYAMHNSTTLEMNLTGLKPATLYELYLESHLMNTAGFQSIIKTVETKPYNPDIPENIHVSEATLDYMIVSWEPPRSANQRIDHYIVQINPMHYQHQKGRHHNYDICNDAVRKRFIKEIQRSNSNQTIAKDEKEPDGKLNLPNKISSIKQCSTNMNEDAYHAEENKREKINLAYDLAMLRYPSKPDHIRNKRSIIDEEKLKLNCKRTRREIKPKRNRMKRGLRKKISVNPNSKSNDTSLDQETAQNQEYFEFMQQMLTSYARNLSLNVLIPYLQTPRLSRTCLTYILYVTEVLSQKPTHIPNHDRDFSSCNETLEVKDEAQYCFQNSSTPYERIVNSNYINITYFSHPLYEIRVKACHAPITSEEKCPSAPNFTCQLCSLWFASKTLRVPLTDSPDFYVNISERYKNRIKVSWSKPLGAFKEDILGYDIFLRELRDVDKINQTLHETRVCRNSSESHAWLEILKPGNYSVEVSPFSQIKGNLKRSQSIKFEMQELENESSHTNSQNLILSFLGLLFVFIILSVFIAKKIIKEFRKNSLLDKLESVVNEKYENTPAWKTHLKIRIKPRYVHERKNLKIIGLLDEGKFGFVSRGELKISGGEIQVAAKQLKPDMPDDVLQYFVLIDEACLMLQIQSFHVVQTYGVVVSDTELYLVMEMMHHGSLNKYLTENRKSDNVFKILSEQQVNKMLVQIADGMAYLNHKNILHMDLAARNCLLNSNFDVKISDFGLSRILEGEYYKSRANKPVPFRWMPPEYFLEDKFTTHSDIWSYGIVIWEILNAGKTPYERMDAEAVKAKVIQNQNLSADIPGWTPSYLKELMEMCWQFHPQNRPQFASIASQLLKHTDDDFQAKFKTNSFCQCRDISNSKVFPVYSLSEGHISTEEISEHITPKTPLTGSPLMALSPKCRRAQSRLSQNGTILRHEKWRQIFHSIHDISSKIF